MLKPKTRKRRPKYYLDGDEEGDEKAFDDSEEEDEDEDEGNLSTASSEEDEEEEQEDKEGTLHSYVKPELSQINPQTKVAVPQKSAVNSRSSVNSKI